MKLLGVSLLSFLLSAAPVVGAERPWFEVRTPSAIVLTDDSEATARRVAHRVEVVQAALPHFLPLGEAGASAVKPVMVFVGRHGDWRMVGPGHPGRASALMLPMPSVHALLVPLEQAGEDRLASLLVSMAYRSLLHSQERRMPLWLERGLTEFYDDTVVRDDRLAVGKPSSSNARGTRNLMPIADVIMMTSAQFYQRKPDEQWVFASTAWLLVHYLTIGDDGVHGPKLNAFLEALARGMEGREAATLAFGDLGALRVQVREYARRGRFPFLDIPFSPKVAPAQSLVVRRLSDSERLARSAWFPRPEQFKDEKRTLAHQALALDGKNGLAAEILAGMAETAEEREKWARQALASTGAGFEAKWTLATVLLGKGSMAGNAAQRQEAETLLSEISRDYPYFAAAPARLAKLLLSEPADLARAESLVRRALLLEGSDPSHHETMALVLAMQGKVDESYASLLRARRLRGPKTDPRQALLAEVPDTGRLDPTHANVIHHGCVSEGLAPACFALASWHERGGFGEPDIAKAVELYGKACALKHEAACAKVEALGPVPVPSPALP